MPLSDEQMDQLYGGQSPPPGKPMSDADMDKSFGSPKLNPAQTFQVRSNQMAEKIKAGGKLSSDDISDLAKEAASPTNPVTAKLVQGIQSGLVGENITPAIAGIKSMFSSGAAKITGLLSSEHGIHPIVEAAEEGGSKINPDYLNFLKKDSPMFKPAEAAVAPAAPLATEAIAAAEGSKGPLSIGTKDIFNGGGEGAAPAPKLSDESHGVISHILEHMGVPTSAAAARTVVGGYIGHHMAEEAGLPGWMGAGLGAMGGMAAGKAYPLTIKAFSKTADGLTPIFENPVANSAIRAYVAGKKESK